MRLHHHALVQADGLEACRLANRTAARPSGRPAAAKARAPAIELSSSQVARISSGCRKG